VEEVVVVDVEAVADLAKAETFTAQGDGLLAEVFEVGVSAVGAGHVVIVVRNADVRVETLVDSPVRADLGHSSPETAPSGAAARP
jgi:hypothetical protein